MRSTTLTFADQKSHRFLQDVVHGCCNPASSNLCEIHILCPFCHCARFKLFVQNMYTNKGLSEDQIIALPLFPNQLCHAVSKFARLESQRVIIANSGEHMTDPCGYQRFSGHSVRRSSLKWYVDSGLSLRETMAISRHSSRAVLDYMEGVESIRTVAIAAKLRGRLEPKATCPVDPTIVSLLAKPAEKWRFIESHSFHAFVCNSESSKVHGLSAPTDYKTKCGFKHSCSAFAEVVKVLHDGWTRRHLCGTCF